MKWVPVLAAPVLAAVVLAGCDRPSVPSARGDTPGDRLETAAIATGVVADPARADPVGLYARGDDRLCVVPGGRDTYRIGVLVSYDDQGCVARGTARRTGDRLAIVLGETGDRDGAAPCRFAARFEGDRIVFPAEVPAGCARACTGRASIAALDVDRSSDGVAEAAAQRDRERNPLCGG